MRKITWYLLVFTVTRVSTTLRANQAGFYEVEHKYPEKILKMFSAIDENEARDKMRAILADHRSLKAKKPRLFPLLKNIMKTNRRKS